MRNTFITFFRNFRKNKTYGFLNIFGLAIGIACTGLIFLWVESETSFDSVHLKKNRIYMVMNNWPFIGHFATYSSTPGLMGPAIKSEIPGVINTCRTTEGFRTILVRSGERSFYSNGYYVDSSFFSVFSVHFVQGNPAIAFKQPYSIVITESAVKKFFGDEKNVIGKTVRFDNAHDYQVTGVISDLPENNTFQLEWVAPFEIFYKENDWLSNWDSNGILTFVELDGKSSLASIDNLLHDFIKKRVKNTIVSSFLFPMSDWHLRSGFENGKPTGRGRIEFVRMFTLIAWIILFLACINFMNLSTARSEKRAKEVGVRKVLGSGRSRLVSQFIGEAVLIAYIAVLLGILLMALAIPAFNTLSQKSLSLNLGNPLHIVWLLLVGLLCGIVAGSYPSLYLSSFNPVFVLKGTKLKTGSAGVIRKGLVIAQFSISIILIISTIIIYQQIQHVKSRDLGYDKDNLIVMDVQGDMGKRYPSIKQDLLATGLVENTALTSHDIIYGGNNSDHYSWNGKDPNQQAVISQRYVSPETISVNGIKLIAGRDFNANAATDSMNIIVTQSLARLMKLANPVGSVIYDDSTPYKIVGMVKDFIYGDMYNGSDPVIFFCSPHNEYSSNMYIRLRPGLDPAQAVARIGAIMKSDNPVYPFQYHFVDDQFNQMFLAEMLVSKLSRVFAALAIIISCLGLFGLAAYTAERRTKEIGIRKVLGATVPGLAGLLSFEFLQLIAISSLVAFPIAWFAMHTWLQNYSYRVTIHWWVFGAAAIAGILISMVTISYQALRAALANPVNSLRADG
ncbi:MAG TPA: ABC transporter permease [Puia sp.]|nr:ABC transporter permease [Puia sp.]